jgi:hypothetical protein
MEADCVVAPTGSRIPVQEMNVGDWFRPLKLHSHWLCARGVCRRLGQNSDGSVNCVWMEKPGGEEERFSLLSSHTTAHLDSKHRLRLYQCADVQVYALPCTFSHKERSVAPTPIHHPHLRGPEASQERVPAGPRRRRPGAICLEADWR